MFFFFQAEDGIRDWSVTGVQTCALPICWTVQMWFHHLQRQPCCDSRIKGVPALFEDAHANGRGNPVGGSHGTERATDFGSGGEIGHRRCLTIAPYTRLAVYCRASDRRSNLGSGHLIVELRKRNERRAKPKQFAGPWGGPAMRGGLRPLFRASLQNWRSTKISQRSR